MPGYHGKFGAPHLSVVFMTAWTAQVPRSGRAGPREAVNSFGRRRF